MWDEKVHAMTPFFQKQPSRDGVADDWNTYEQPAPENHFYTQQDNKAPVINYGSTETHSNNPFHSTNPFASDISASLVQPPATDSYAHDVVHNQQWNWEWSASG